MDPQAFEARAAQSHHVLAIGWRSAIIHSDDEVFHTVTSDVAHGYLADPGDVAQNGADLECSKEQLANERHVYLSHSDHLGVCNRSPIEGAATARLFDRVPRDAHAVCCAPFLTKSFRPEARSLREAMKRLPLTPFVEYRTYVDPSPEPFKTGPTESERWSAVPVSWITLPVYPLMTAR